MDRESPSQGESDRTVDGILRLLKTNGPTDVGELASQLDVTGAAVRQHLYRLREKRLVDCEEESRPLGRPAKLWRLMPQANRYFPDAHAQLTQSLLKSIEETYGKKGLDRVVSQCAREQIENYHTKLGSTTSLKARLAALVEIRNHEGYMAEAREEADGSLMLIENHCPICAAAEARSEFCDAELAVFRTALGSDVAVEREEYIFSGARRCAFRIRRIHDKST